MPQDFVALINAFKEDHAILGRGLYAIAQCLRAGDIKGARAAAKRLDKEVGAHIAFEEEAFYPVLGRFLSSEDIERMYAEHGQGLAAVRALKDVPPDVDLSKEECERLMTEVEEMERHVEGCGELFEHMGRIPEEEQADLLRRLLDWRRKHPMWTDYVDSVRGDNPST